jgi:hypothetical protein
MDTNIDLINGSLLGSGSSPARRLKGLAHAIADVHSVKATIRTDVTVRRLGGVVFCEANSQHRWSSRLASKIDSVAYVIAVENRLRVSLSFSTQASASSVSKLRASVALRSQVRPSASVLTTFGVVETRLSSSTSAVAKVVASFGSTRLSSSTSAVAKVVASFGSTRLSSSTSAVAKTYCSIYANRLTGFIHIRPNLFANLGGCRLASELSLPFYYYAAIRVKYGKTIIRK